MSTLESIARVAPFWASSVPPPSLIVWLPVLSVSVTPEPSARTVPVLSERQVLEVDPFIADLAGGGASMVVALVKSPPPSRRW